MRRILPVAFGCVLLAVPLFAQRGGGGRGGGGGHMGGGGAHFSGGGGFRGGSAFRGGSGFRGGTAFRGNSFRTFNGFRNGFRGRFGYGYGGYYYPWLYGAYWNPFWGDFGDYGDYYGDPYSDYGYTGDGGYSYAQPSPQVLIISNQTPPPEGFAPPPPAPAVWNATPSAAAQAKKYEEPLYLLAMNDGTIRAVLAYWVDGTTVHYVTMDHVQKQTSLGSLDRGLSERLNRERNVAFQLPG